MRADPPALRLVVLASGEGTNLQAILDAIEDGRLHAEVLAVISDREGAGALGRAEAAGVSTAHVPFAPYRASGRDRAAYDADLGELVAAFRPDVVVLAGWMRILTPSFLNRFPERVVNLHPALPGAFPGRDAIGQAWAAWEAGTLDHTGLMVHLAVPEVDAGPVLATRTIRFEAGESREDFEERLHAAEHEVLVDVLRAWSQEPGRAEA